MVILFRDNPGDRAAPVQGGTKTGVIDMVHSFIPLVQNSFVRVFAHKAELTERFYFHLFEALPEVRGLFKKEFFHQKEMFSTMLAATVRSMSSVGSFQELGQRLAHQHAGFGVRPEQYKAAANALIAALKDVLDGQLSPEEEEAWQTAITELTNQMMLGPEVRNTGT